MTSQFSARAGEGERRPPDQNENSLSRIAGGLAGICDRVVGAVAEGWAIRVAEPGHRLRVEQWVDGVLAGSATANMLRTDLREQGVGDGRHGWKLNIALDPYKTRPQRVEIRLTSGELLPNGKFDLTFDPSMLVERAEEDTPATIESQLPAEPKKTAPSLKVAQVEGAFDGLDDGMVRGWAWRPEFPEQHVQVEQWIDGVLAGVTIADLPRADLSAAGRGHGGYGWSMKLALDLAKVEPQSVELRIRGDGPIAGGLFTLTRDAVAADKSTSTHQDSENVLDRNVGWYDGIKGAAFDGWAWNPARPDATVTVELWVNGVLKQEVAADGFRPDLRANGVGHGRYGWRLPIQRDPDRVEPLQIEIRIKDGEPVVGGVFQLKNDLLLDDPANAHLRSFVNSVLGVPREAPAPGRLPIPKTAMLIFCAEPREVGTFWAREYDDYRGAAKYFATVLASLGEVVELATLDDVARECLERKAAGEACLLFAFGPLRTAPLDAPCPVVPVFGWAFPSIPTGMWDGDRRSDWRYVLRTTGRAIALSEFARDAAVAVMGPQFPLAVIPVPVADRISSLPAANISAEREVRVTGVVLDSRDHVFDPGDTTVPPPVWTGDEGGQDGKSVVRISGVLFTSMLDISDGRENWHDLISAFAAAHRGNSDATLLIILSEANAGWWREIFTWLRLMPQFACRIIVVRGNLDEDDRRALIGATSWYVNVPRAAALRLSLQEFMSAGRPAISVAHTAMADYVTTANAILVDADEEPWTWPDPAEKEGWSWTQHPADVGVTSRYRLSWISLNEAYAEAYRQSTAAPSQYSALAEGAVAIMRAVCGDDVVVARLAEFIGPKSPSALAALGPSALLREPPE